MTTEPTPPERDSQNAKRESQNGPDSGAANNPTPDPAIGSEGTPPILDELYDTLGDVERGIDLRKQEAADDRTKLLQQEEDLIAQRQEAQDSGDTDQYAQLTSEVEAIARALAVIDDEELGAGTTDQHDDSAGTPGSEQRGAGSDRDPGGGQPLAGGDAGGELQRGADSGPPDAQ